MSYGERMNLELRSVVEDQWKKQLLEEMEEELKTNLGELEKQKKEEPLSKYAKHVFYYLLLLWLVNNE